MSDTTNKKPSDFDWVSTRKNCSVHQMFEDLRTAVDRDVQMVASLLGDSAPIDIRISGDDKKFKVFLSARHVGGSMPSVLFTLSKQSIVVKDGTTGTIQFEITIGLNDEGDCNYIVDGKALDSWQVRRRALEELFFYHAGLGE